MKKKGMIIGVCMGIVMSLVLSLTGTLTSGHFTVPMFLSSFAVSAIISVLIGLIVPIGRLEQSAVQKAGLKPQSLKSRLLGALVSNTIFTPLMTLIMVALAHHNAAAHAPAGQVPPFLAMLLPSLVICYLVGYVVILLIQPVIVKLVMGRDKK